MRLEVGKQASPTFSWRTALNNLTESRFDRDLDESRLELGWDMKLNRRRSLVAEFDLNKGTEDFDGDSWIGSSFSVDIKKQTDRSTSGGYRLAWEEQKLEHSDGTIEWTDKVSALVNLGIETSSGWTFSSSLGMDGIQPHAGKRRWEPRAEIILASAPGQRFRLNSSLSTLSTLQDPVEGQISWSRNSLVQAGVVWSVSRAFTIEPSTQFHHAELFGNGIADRTDETLILSLETRWVMTRDWSLGLSTKTEDRTSSQVSFDFYENRLELRLSGAFH
jgi:hypothetical protein